MIIKMKNLFVITLLALGSLALTGCSKTASESICTIHGTVPDPSKEGKKIFLIPMFGKQDAEHVDSTVIKDGKFEFRSDSAEMKIIRLDYHYRDNVQELLVVTEPGELQVAIGPDSRCSGTPQNDSLQVWKDNIIRLNKAYNLLRMQNDRQPSDSAAARMKEMQAEFKSFNHAFYSRQPAGIFKDFLKKTMGEQ